MRSTWVLAFVVFERRPGMCLRLFAPLRAKITSSAQSLVVLAALHSITSSARASKVGATLRSSILAVLRLIIHSNLVPAEPADRMVLPP
jgi:hypothetical protein